jgi:DNA-binding CsgD family transcriptional regulator
MKPRLFVPPRTAAQQRRLQKGLRSPYACTVRRCQILRASAQGLPASAIARQLGCTLPTVRNAIPAFAREGLDCLHEKSRRPHSARSFGDQTPGEAIQDLWHHSPRRFGKPTSLWTLDRVAEVCHQNGWTPRLLTGETIRVALKRRGIRGQRAKHWITRADPASAREKKLGIA